MLWLSFVEWAARLILVLLIVLSVWSVAIIIERRRFFKAINLPTSQIKEKIRLGTLSKESTHFMGDFLAEVKDFKNSDSIDKAFDSFAIERRQQLEKGISILGTLGSTTPFVGLLGTILGIIVSFGELSKGAGSTNSVMFSLAEALILTAVGLVVAIPAVVAFNYFNRKIKTLMSDAQSIKDLYVAYRGQ